MGIKTPSIGHWQGVEFIPHSVSRSPVLLIPEARHICEAMWSTYRTHYSSRYTLGIQVMRNESLQVGYNRGLEQPRGVV